MIGFVIRDTVSDILWEMDGQIRVRLEGRHENEELVEKKSESIDHLHDDEAVGHTGKVSST